MTDDASVAIVFETHATSLDNEQRLASGDSDVGLSVRGQHEAHDLGRRYAHDQFDAIYCPDHRRAMHTAQIAFGARAIPVLPDRRLRECDYAIMTRYPLAEAERAKPRHVTVPFPNGKSYPLAALRIGEYLREITIDHAGGRVLIIGTRATHYGLEHWLNQVPLAQAVRAPFQWQPGWAYRRDPAAMTVQRTTVS